MEKTGRRKKKEEEWCVSVGGWCVSRTFRFAAPPWPSDPVHIKRRKEEQEIADKRGTRAAQKSIENAGPKTHNN